MILLDETIAAIATPNGTGGLAVVRLSGDQAVEIIDTVFKGKQPIVDSASHTSLYGWIWSGQTKIDEVIVTFFKGPNSYTGEDVVEIGCHGGVYVTRTILELLIKRGARLAEPGEFTQRAFMNGRLDLTQAEAVADLIHAKTEAARSVAVSQLEGRLSAMLNGLRDGLVEMCTLLEIELDFAEEDLTFAARNDLELKLRSTAEQMQKLLGSFERGRVCREGIRMILWGKPNVGKSSLLNALVEKERAIVTDIPGTTRDTIEDVLDMDGLCFTVVDTAGVRISSDRIEQEGVRRAEEAMQSADLILLVLDTNQLLDDQDKDVIQYAREFGKPVIVALNKSDLPVRIEKDAVQTDLPDAELIPVSALHGTGMDELIQHLEKTVLAGGIPAHDEVVIAQVRHAEILRNVNAFLEHALDALLSGMTQEFVAADVRLAMNALGEITGHTTPDDILNNIFSEFCVGK